MYKRLFDWKKSSEYNWKAEFPIAQQSVVAAMKSVQRKPVLRVAKPSKVKA